MTQLQWKESDSAKLVSLPNLALALMENISSPGE